MSETRPITKFAVVGAGHIAQAAVLPAFSQAEGCELVALVSSDVQKRDKLQRQYQIAEVRDYGGYDELLASGKVDAVYIALPNHLHAQYAVRAANAGVHVLCEKPMAPSEHDCERMIEAAHENEVRLMIAYRLHFESINLSVIDLIKRGAIGEPRVFSSVFSQNVKPGDVRLNPVEKGGGSVFDLGIYCINAARYLFRKEPLAVSAKSSFGRDERFQQCDEMTSAILQFPDGELAQFTSSFGAYRLGEYEVVGSEGRVLVRHAYDYSTEMSFELIRDDGERQQKKLPKRDQFAPQLVYFARCIQEGREPEPDGWEGLADVRIVQAIYESDKTGRSVSLQPVPQNRRPSLSQAMKRPGFPKPAEIHASGPSQ